MAHSATLFLQDDVEYRKVYLDVSSEGARILGHDMGPKVEKFWGDDDYEFWVDVPTEALAHLAFALLRDKYTNEERAVDKFQKFCADNGVEHTFKSLA
ncbi:hypothetical protein HB777_25650 [Mesorhizobium loti]|nr:hypothetical protein HB777_25650 [Mesorhizobium loti]